ncbi:protein of unknown function (plasmid) [Azospirillum lipoferum 4B]|uniref:Uncharacterized protein n=1 Tax=Azospirillum lipoferum (strain 4B) TaxID=862719 RepID=G7ZGI9_AZOL4|nr:protein of unknown function [Azospirillum lipoferum 4B]
MRRGMIGAVGEPSRKTRRPALTAVKCRHTAKQTHGMVGNNFGILQLSALRPVPITSLAMLLSCVIATHCVPA